MDASKSLHQETSLREKNLQIKLRVEADENDSFWFGGLTVNLELPFIYTGVYGTNYLFTVNDF